MRDKEEPLSKRQTIPALSSVFFVSSMSAPAMVIGKFLFSETCLNKILWNETLPEDILRSLQKWTRSLEDSNIIMLRSVSMYNAIWGIIECSFVYMKLRMWAAIYAYTQSEGKLQISNLLVVKSWVTSTELKMSRLELVACYYLDLPVMSKVPWRKLVRYKDVMAGLAAIVIAIAITGYSVVQALQKKHWH